MFRGKRTDTGEWIKGWLIYHDGIAGIIEYNDFTYSDNGGALDFGYVPVFPNSVATQTGVRDKNKKMIYGSIKLDGKMTKGGDEVQVKHTTSISGLSGLDSLTEFDVEQTWNGPVLWDIDIASFIIIENKVRASKLFSIYEYEIISNQYDN